MTAREPSSANLTLREAVASLYALHQRKQRYGATGVPAAELKHATEQALAISRQHSGHLGESGEAPPQPLTLFAQGLCTCLAQPGRTGAATAAPKLQAALKLEPGLLEAWIVLAYCALDQGDIPHAISCILRGLRMHRQSQSAGCAPVSPTLATHVNADADTAEGSCSPGTRQQDTSTLPPAMRSSPKAPTPSTAGSSGGGAVPSRMDGDVYESATTSESDGRSDGDGCKPLAGFSASQRAAKEGLQLLSMLVRQQQQQVQIKPNEATESTLLPPDPKAALTRALELSRDLANEALEMYVADAYSWYVLALAELSTYLQAPLLRPGTSSCRPRQLQRLLASFSQAERHGLSDLADLYFNRATLHTFCQSFPEALADYERAQALDPSLPVAQQVESLRALLSQLSSLVESRGGIKTKQWSKVTALLARDAAKAHQLLSRGLLHHQPGLVLVGAQELSTGHNRGRALLCRPLVFISPPLNASAALYIVCVDTSACCLALALVRIPHNAFSMNQQLIIVNPELLNIRVMQRGKQLAFPLVKVDSSSDSVLLVDGVPVQQD